MTAREVIHHQGGGEPGGKSEEEGSAVEELADEGTDAVVEADDEHQRRQAVGERAMVVLALRATCSRFRFLRWRRFTTEIRAEDEGDGGKGYGQRGEP